MRIIPQRRQFAQPVQDRIARELTPLVRGLLSGLAVCAALGALLSLVIAQTPTESFNIVCYGLLICGCVMIARWLLRRGHFQGAVALVTVACLFVQSLNYTGLGTERGAGILVIFVLPVAMAGFLLSRRGLILTIAASFLLVLVTALLETFVSTFVGIVVPASLPQPAILSAFFLVITLLGVFIDRYGAALRHALEDELEQQRKLEQAHRALGMRTSELESAKIALEHERDLLHTLMDNLPDMIYFKDTRSRFTRINRVQARVLGVANPADAIGKTDFDFQAAELSHSFFAEEQRMFADGEAIHDRLEFNPTCDGKPRWFSASKAPIYGRDGRIIGMVGLSRDITARYEVERMKNEFVATVSHELRTPLTSLRGSLALLTNGVAGELPAAAQSMLAIAQNNSTRLGRLVDDLLDLEKLEAGKLAFQMTSVDLTAVVAQALEANREYARQYQVSLALVRATPDAYVRADAGRLHQVLNNLLSNAAKFSPPGATVDVAIDRTEAGMRVSVSDHGPGIPEEFRSRIFGKFAQADASDTRAKNGTGLGLSIAKALIECMGGNIGYNSEVGAGTTFMIGLPAEQPAE